MDTVIELIIDLLVPSGRRRRGPSLTGWLGTALTIVMLGLGLAGGVLFARELSKVGGGAPVMALLIPFGGTLLAGLAGVRGGARSVVAGLLSAFLAATFGAFLAVADALLLPW